MTEAFVSQSPRGVLRQREIQPVLTFLQEAATRSTGLIVDGDAGIGKTTLWQQSCDEAAARGFQVLTARGDPGEVSLTFAVLADLLAEVDPAVIARLPLVQRDALNRVLLRGSTGPAMDERAAAAAFRSVLHELAKSAPVLVAIDDVQWLDTSSAMAVRFAARRLTGPVGVLVTMRTGEPNSETMLAWSRLTGPEVVSRLRMTPLTLGGVHALVAHRLGHVLPRPTMRRIHEISGGNPLYAIELARAAADGRGLTDELPDTLAALVRERIRGVDAETEQVLLAAACTPAPTVAVVARATGHTEHEVLTLLEKGAAERIVVIAGNRIRFSHPLLATGVYTGAAPGQRREMHRRLAEVLSAPELRARHLASAATTADTDTLDALDAAAAVTRSQGAPAAAAELLELAINLGGDTPVRRIILAQRHFEAGSISAARHHLDQIRHTLPPGVLRGSATLLHGAIDGYDGSFTAAVEGLAAGVAETGEVPALQLQGLMLLAPTVAITGRDVEALGHARDAVALAERLGDATAHSQALTMWALLAFNCGDPSALDALRRAQELQGDATAVHVHLQADAIAAVVAAWMGDVASASTRLDVIREQCVQRGSELDILWVDQHATMTKIAAGDYRGAARITEEMAQRAEQIGGHQARLFALTCGAAVASYLGDVEGAKASAASAVQIAEDSGGRFLAVAPRTTLGFLHVTLGDHAAAVNLMQPLMEDFDPNLGCESMRAGWLPDAVEALSGLGRIDEAEALVTILEEEGARLQRSWMLAVGARGRALCHAARGDLDSAEDAATSALSHHHHLPMPFEKARTQMVLGQLHRRRRRRAAATAVLSEALRTFEAIDAPLWARRAQTELDRLTAKTAPEVGLSPAEERVARRAAGGMANKEIAAELFLSTKTVEANLSTVYRKLGIKSRSQLYARLHKDARVNTDSRGDPTT
ncbi:AAA family ATPase [Mycobacterium manitobense]|uniref:AAA family ATPase n=1 Tax=[Mycobacterium] manitobense TaxID=190147 RepID=A0A9X2Y7A9_9MYCO|nr:LuxR family transcriptional regulator [[Mycobacterium] manitobense]MCV7169253.1 AAA family ATPase [[Mycobacterium] manitobense]